MKDQFAAIWENLKFTLLYDRTTSAIIAVAGFMLGALIF